MSKSEKQTKLPAKSQYSPDHYHSCEWKKRYELEKKRTAQLLTENADLLERIRDLTENGSDVSADEEDDSELPTAIWDEFDGIECCTDCGWEVVAGVCYGCGAEFSYDSDDGSEEGKDQGVFTQDTLIQSDRFPKPRGTTPLLEVDTFRHSLPGWDGSEKMYKALMERGATRLMISTFQMEFFDDRGIIAWADDTMYDHFSGPGMKKGDQWMIMLGRRIKLDKDDLDGSVFIEDLLEDAIVRKFPVTRPTWETVRLSPGSSIWVTRPIGDRPDPKKMDEDTSSDDEDDEDEDDEIQEDESKAPVLHFDDYEPSEVDLLDVANEPEPIFVDSNAPDKSDNDYETSDEEVDELEAHQADVNTNKDMAMNVVAPTAGSETAPQEGEVPAMEIDDSEPGSDWDEDEELSGDEDVLLGRT